MTQKEKDFCEALAKLMDDYGITMRVVVPVDDPYCYGGSFVTFAETNKEEETTKSLCAYDDHVRDERKDEAYTIFTSSDIRNHIEELTAKKGIENV